MARRGYLWAHWVGERGATGPTTRPRNNPWGPHGPQAHGQVDARIGGASQDWVGGVHSKGGLGLNKLHMQQEAGGGDAAGLDTCARVWEQEKEARPAPARAPTTKAKFVCVCVCVCVCVSPCGSARATMGGCGSTPHRSAWILASASAAPDRGFSFTHSLSLLHCKQAPRLYQQGSWEWAMPPSGLLPSHHAMPLPCLSHTPH